MDLSSKYSDLMNDDSLINVLNELDEFNIKVNEKEKAVEQNLPLNDQNLKTQTLSINSTRYDSDSSSVVLGEEQYTKQPKQWLPYQKKFDLHISKTLGPLIKYIVESPLNIDGKQIYFTKKKTYLEYLVNETVESYRSHWKRLYGSAHYGSQELTNDQTEGDKTCSLEEGEKDCVKVIKGLSSFDMNSFIRSTSIASGYETEAEITQELGINDVFVESGCRHELVETLYLNGMEQFYNLLDFLFSLIKNTKHDYKIIQTMDLLTNMLKLMPELSVLLIIPIKKDSTFLSKGRCYFKYLVDKLKIRFRLNRGSILEIYKRFLKHEFVPFYMNNPYHTSDHSEDRLDERDMELDDYGEEEIMEVIGGGNANSNSNVGGNNSINGNSSISGNNRGNNNDNNNAGAGNNVHSTNTGSNRHLSSNMRSDSNDSGYRTNELVVVYVLDRLINLVNVLSERVFEFTNMNLDEQIKTSLLKKMKKFLFLPFLGVGSFHELFLPFSGNFKFSEVRSVGYRGIIAKYLYPPPALYTLRLRVLKILELVTGANLVKYRGHFYRTNRSLTESESVSGISRKVDKVFINYIHLLSFGASFMLMGEFMKKSVENPVTFFGSYLFLMPHFRINYSNFNEALVIEENVYRLQKSTISFLSNLNEPRVFTNDDFMSIKCIGLTQSNALKRMLSLLVHYVSNTTELEIEEAKLDLNVDNEFNISKTSDMSCSKYCDLIVPYNTNTIASYLLKVHKRERMVGVADKDNEDYVMDTRGDKKGKGDVDSKGNRGSRNNKSGGNNGYKKGKEELVKYDRAYHDCDYYDDSDMFVYNDCGKLNKMQVDVCNYEEFDKITRYSLNPGSYYIPLEYIRDVRYKVSDRPLVEFRTKTASSAPTTAANSKLSTSRTDNILLASNGFAFKSDYARVESTDMNSMINRENTIGVEDNLFNSEDDSTNREGSMERRSESCGHICLLKRHMVCESRFKHVLELRKQLVIQLLETLSCHPPEKLGELEPVYHSFIMKLMY